MHSHVLGSRAGKQSCKPRGNCKDSTRDHFREGTELDNADLQVVQLPLAVGIAGWRSLACTVLEVRQLIREVPSGLKIYKFRSG